MPVFVLLAVQVLDALASNLKREHVLRIMLNCFVWGRSLNSIQFAKSAVYSHPFFPDVSGSQLLLQSSMVVASVVSLSCNPLKSISQSLFPQQHCIAHVHGACAVQRSVTMLVYKIMSKVGRPVVTAGACHGVCPV